MKLPNLTTIVMFLHSAAAWILGRAEFTCYRSSSSEAKNIRTVYDYHNPNGDFWYWNNSLLVPCNFSHIYSSSSKCSVCIDDSVRPETVIVVFSNLSSSVQPVFEGPETALRFYQSDCPRLPPAGHTTPAAIAIPAADRPNNDRGRFGLYAALVPFIIIIIIIFIACKRYKSQQAPGDGRCSVPQSESTAIIMNGNGNSEPLVVQTVSI